MSALHRLDASTTITAARNGQVSCRDVVEAHLARIAEHDGAIHATTVVLAEEARAAADKHDADHRNGGVAPLRGMVVTVKETLDVVGSATTHGLRALSHALPFVDAPAVARLREAGAVVIARTNTSELAMRLCTDNPLRGRTHNPWGRAISVGGSSGGDAAAVALGMAHVGLGMDMGGSLRVPAHFCGVAALKPTAGRIPHASSLEPQDTGFSGQAMAVVGPLARSVADLRLVLGVLAGRHVRDPRSVDAPLRGPAPDEKRAALVTALPGAPLPADVVQAVKAAGQALEDAGWTVEEATPPEVDRACEAWTRLVATDLVSTLPLSRPHISPELAGHLDRMVREGRLQDVSNHRLHVERSRLMRAWSGFFQEYAVVVGPNVAVPPWAPDADLDPVRGVSLLREATRFILPHNVLGLPSVALPMGLQGGWPNSIQVCADAWREDLCLEAAAIIEAKQPRITPVEPRVGA